MTRKCICPAIRNASQKSLRLLLSARCGSHRDDRCDRFVHRTADDSDAPSLTDLGVLVVLLGRYVGLGLWKLDLDTQKLAIHTAYEVGQSRRHQCAAVDLEQEDSHGGELFLDALLQACLGRGHTHSLWSKLGPHSITAIPHTKRATG